MKCPKCNENLMRELYEDVEIDRCKDCEGVWLDRSEIRVIVDKRIKKFSSDERIATFKPADKKEEEKVLNCPKCQKVMEKFNYAITSQILLDRCPEKHGIWLDSGELEKVQIFMEEYDREYLKSTKDVKESEMPGVKRCPRCDETLRVIEYEGIELDLCPKCRGYWCDNQELKMVIDRREKEFTEKDFPNITASEADKKISQRDELLGDINCPFCGGPLMRRNYAYSSGIIIDSCNSGHGVWLDEGEIEKVQVFIERADVKKDEYLKRYSGALKKGREVTEKRWDDTIKKIKPSRFGVINRLFQNLVRKDII